MTVRILEAAPNSEAHNAELFRAALVASEPKLDHPDITADILFGLPLPGRQLDIVMLYHDARPPHLQLATPSGVPIHSFVLVLEVKQHSPELIRWQGSKLEVRYGQQWHDASHQCDAQMWALKAYQKSAYWGRNRRSETFVQRAIWLPRAPRRAFSQVPAESSVPAYFAELEWHSLVENFSSNVHFEPGKKSIRTLVDDPNHPKYHSLETLRDCLAHEVRPTRLDLRRVDALTQTRFDAEKTAYIQNLGTGLLVLRGRGGTGKTFALLQIALHLARQGKTTLLLTYNHGLIADISRALRIVGDKHRDISSLPSIQTRYAFIQDAFIRVFGLDAEKQVREIDDIEAREEYRLARLMNHAETIASEYDFVLVDEGQDWAEEQRDFLYRLFGPERVIVADGVDQFVGQARCDWDRGAVPINRRHRLKASRRTKGATCQTVAEIARELGLIDWDLEPDPDTFGGRFTVIVEADAQKAVRRGLELIGNDQRDDKAVKAVDNLICLPSEKMAKGVSYASLFDRSVEAAARDSWRGFLGDDRRNYPQRETQLRAVQYSSCRGMEGWSTLCLGLDLFYDFQRRNARIDVKQLEISLRERDGLLYTPQVLEQALEREVRLFAINWLMIPLTRSIDHLVVHLADEQSELGKILSRVSERFPGAIEWLV